MSDRSRRGGEPERQHTGSASTREDATLREAVLEDSPIPEVSRQGREEREERSAGDTPPASGGER